MKPIEIVELIKKSNPALLGNIADAKAARIVRAALVKLGEQLDVATDGVVNVPGLGNFQVKQVALEKDGKKETVKRIIFKVVKPKTKEE